ncbi:unnamed protein product [Microthlaspi erraticum]|uniref:Uncharacterized protein n=1 Tax=Microthlaspi erraticum TaxID=1685480 RepID=A0A6D2KBQ2_9BRAS|nr:unnamed protein product [Microthlaspi erraticum]
MLQLTPTHYAQRPRCAPGSSPPDGVSQGHFNLTPHSRLGLALIPNYNAPTAPPGQLVVASCREGYLKGEVSGSSLTNNLGWYSGCGLIHRRGWGVLGCSPNSAGPAVGW